MSLFELADYDFQDGNPFGMGDLGASAAAAKAAADKKAAAALAAAAKKKAAADLAAAKKADALAFAAAKKAAANLPPAAKKVAIADANAIKKASDLAAAQAKKSAVTAATAVKKATDTAIAADKKVGIAAEKAAADIERDAQKSNKDLVALKAKTAAQKQTNDILKVQRDNMSAKLKAIKAQPPVKAAVSGIGYFEDDLEGCCGPGLFGLAECQQMAEDGVTCLDQPTTTGVLPANIQLPPFEPPAAPKGCEGGAKPRRKDCIVYNAVVDAFKLWYEMLKQQIQYQSEISALQAQIDALTAQLQGGGYCPPGQINPATGLPCPAYQQPCMPGQIDPLTGQMCQTYPGQYPGQGCPAGFSIEPTTGQCTPVTMGPTDAGYPSQYGIPGGGGGQFVPEQTLGPGGDAGGGDEMGLPADFVPFGAGQTAPQLPYQQPQYAEPFVEQQASPPGGGVPFIAPSDGGQYAPPELAVEVTPDDSVRQQRTAPEDVEQGMEPVVYGGDEEYGAVNDFMEESDGMSGLTNLSHQHHDMVERYFGLGEGPTPPTDIYGKVITGIDKAKEIYEALTGKAKPAPTPVQTQSEFPWAQILLVGGIGLLGYAFYKKSQVRGRR